MRTRLRVGCQIGWLAALAGCNAIFGLDPAGADASTDGASDGSVDAAADGALCMWGPTSNVDACALSADQVMTDWALVAGVTQLNTAATPDTWAVPVGTRGLRQSEDGGRAVAVLMVHDLTIPAAAILRVTGDRPLVILVSGKAAIDGIVTLEGTRRGATTPANACSGNGGAGMGVNTSAGGGGGGGSLATVHPGAAGGGAGAAAGGPAGMPFQDVDAVPLVMGCDGGRGGATATLRGGRGGGGIQISAAVQVAVRGVIAAGGEGGQGGAIGTTPGGGGGGGGGGSGGMILLEAPQVVLSGGNDGSGTGAKLCANGGGGGGSGTLAAEGKGGSAGLCSPGAAQGGPVGVPGQAPGGGGASATAPASPGGTAASGAGGGGGGGGVGTIRINGSLADTADVVSPPYTNRP